MVKVLVVLVGKGARQGSVCVCVGGGRDGGING